PDDDEELGVCAVRARSGSLFGLGIKRPGQRDRTVEYYDVEIEADNASLKMITGSRKVWMIEMKGRSLLRLAYLLKEHRVEFVRQADRDFGPDDGLPFIASLAITDVTERERSG